MYNDFQIDMIEWKDKAVVNIVSHSLAFPVLCLQRKEALPHLLNQRI